MTNEKQNTYNKHLIILIKLQIVSFSLTTNKHIKVINGTCYFKEIKTHFLRKDKINISGRGILHHLKYFFLYYQIVPLILYHFYIKQRFILRCKYLKVIWNCFGFLYVVYNTELLTITLFKKRPRD